MKKNYVHLSRPINPLPVWTQSLTLKALRPFIPSALKWRENGRGKSETEVNQVWEKNWIIEEVDPAMQALGRIWATAHINDISP